MKEYKEIEKTLKEFGQEHLLNFYNELDEEGKKDLLNQISKIDFKQMKNLYENKDKILNTDKKIESIPVIKKENLKDDERQKIFDIGAEIIKNKKIAVCQMAGGQGTRLGYNGPKGTLIINKITPPKSIFEIFSEKLKEIYEMFDVKIKWYIMTSSSNDYETKKFFEENNYFEYGKENISFFVQGELPLLNTDGKIILERKDKIFMAPDGNGGIYEALRKNNILKEMKENNIEYLGIGNVDNILLNLLDPVFVGLMAKDNYELSTKTTTKVSPEEKVGVVCKINNNPGVVEYTEISEEMANKRDENGNLLFGEGYFGCSIFKVDLLEKITDKLYYHVAFKKNNYIDENGTEIKAEKPNTYKFEAFIFEGFNMAKNMLVLNVKREEEFAPIKNKEGVDSIETAAILYSNFKNNNKFNM